jgi:periplasmic protein TonB
MRCTRYILPLFFLLSCQSLFKTGNNKISEGKNEIHQKNISAPDEKPEHKKKTKASDRSDFDEFICEMPIESEVNREKWEAYLNDHLELDSTSLNTIPNGKFTVRVSFIVDEKGNLKEVKVLDDPGFGLGRRVIKVISDCRGLWKPAMFKGHPVISYNIQPITFLIEEDEKEECKNKIPPEFIL